MQVTQFRIISQSRDGRSAEIASAVGTKHALRVGPNKFVWSQPTEELDDEGNILVERFEFEAADVES